jgi:hypothetical protein
MGKELDEYFLGRDDYAGIPCVIRQRSSPKMARAAAVAGSIEFHAKKSAPSS